MDGGHKPSSSTQRKTPLWCLGKGEYGGRNSTDILGCAANQSVTAAEWWNVTLSHITTKVGEFLTPLSSAGTSRLCRSYRKEISLSVLQGPMRGWCNSKPIIGQCCTHCMCSLPGLHLFYSLKYSKSYIMHSCECTPFGY